jgi:hypothetical protein
LRIKSGDCHESEDPAKKLMKTNRKRRKLLRYAVLLIDNLSIGMLWAFALAALAYALFREMTK